MINGRGPSKDASASSHRREKPSGPITSGLSSSAYFPKVTSARAGLYSFGAMELDKVD